MDSKKNFLYIVLIISAVLIVFSLISIFGNFKEFEKMTGFASGYVNITVNTQITINVSNATVNWGPGTVTPPATNASLITHATSVGTAVNGNWSGTNAKAIVVANIGNINCSLALSGVKTAATFFGGSVGNQLYQWNISNKDPGSCGEWGDQSAKNVFADVNTSAATICNKLDFHTSANEIFIDFKLVVPYDASNVDTPLSDIITITGNAAV